MKFRWLYVMVLLYVSAGILHFFIPSFYLHIVPAWVPDPELCVGLSGLVEIILGLLLLPKKTRRYAAWLIIVMLVVFEFVIHIPMAIDYYHKDLLMFVFMIGRILLQLVLIRWAWIYTLKRNDRQQSVQPE